MNKASATAKIKVENKTNKNDNGTVAEALPDEAELLENYTISCPIEDARVERESELEEASPL